MPTCGKCESVDTPIAGFPHDAPQSPILPPTGGFLFQDRAKFHNSFGPDLPAAAAAFMADSQVPWGVDAAAGPVTEPAWRSKPSWYLIATEDHEIPPSAQRAVAQRAGATTVELAVSHTVYITQPAEMTACIKQAASTVAARQ
jgi:hypothetical protein